MKTNPIAEVMKDRLCAHCGSTSVQNQVYRFIGSDDRYISLCNICVIELRRMADDSVLCAYCGMHAKYATWELEKIRSVGDMSFSTGINQPEYWLLCEKHFAHMHKATKMRISQLQLDDFSIDTSS